MFRKLCWYRWQRLDCVSERDGRCSGVGLPTPSDTERRCCCHRSTAVSTTQGGEENKARTFACTHTTHTQACGHARRRAVGARVRGVHTLDSLHARIALLNTRSVSRRSCETGDLSPSRRFAVLVGGWSLARTGRRGVLSTEGERENYEYDEEEAEEESPAAAAAHYTAARVSALASLSLSVRSRCFHAENAHAHYTDVQEKRMRSWRLATTWTEEDSPAERGVETVPNGRDDGSTLRDGTTAHRHTPQTRAKQGQSLAALPSSKSARPVASLATDHTGSTKNSESGRYSDEHGFCVPARGRRRRQTCAVPRCLLRHQQQQRATTTASPAGTSE